MTLSAAQVEQIQGLLADGISQRVIAHELGISRTTVNSIASGKHRRVIAEDHAIFRELGFRRCPTCGWLVQMPCLACGVLGTKGKR